MARKKRDQGDVLNFEEAKESFKLQPEAEIQKNELGLWTVKTLGKIVTTKRHEKPRVWDDMDRCLETLHKLGCKQAKVNMEGTTA